MTELQHPNRPATIGVDSGLVRPESAVVDPPKWLELGYKSIFVNITKSAAAGVLAMSEDQIAAAKQRESERQPFGFHAPEPKRNVKPPASPKKVPRKTDPAPPTRDPREPHIDRGREHERKPAT